YFSSILISDSTVVRCKSPDRLCPRYVYPEPFTRLGVVDLIQMGRTGSEPFQIGEFPMKPAASLFLVSILVLLTPTETSSGQVKTRTKVVNYERTAIRIAEAVLADAYGEEQLK